MTPRKICVVITARPSYARIRSALEEIQLRPALKLQLIVAASALLDRYGNAFQIIEKEGFSIDRRVYMILEGENHITSAKSTGLGLAEMATALDDLKPDMVVTVADRFETMATAIASAYMNIPLVHIQGGEVTGSIDEKVRHAITKLSDYHCVATPLAAERVMKMGEQKDRVFVTGCPSIDLALKAVSKPYSVLEILQRYHKKGVGAKLDLDQPYIVVLQHPVTTEYQKARFHIEETLHAVHKSGVQALWFWPNVDAGSDGTSKGIRAFREQFHPAKIHFFKNIPPEDFLKVAKKSMGLLGNSSVAIRECEALEVPVINIGNRQSGRERGTNVLDVDYDQTLILKAIQNLPNRGSISSHHLYGDGKAGSRIADLLSTIPLTTEKRLAY